MQNNISQSDLKDHPIELYTDLHEAVEEIKRRRNDPELVAKIDEKIGNSKSEYISGDPKLVLFKHIMSPNNENGRILAMAKETKMDLLGLEYFGDKFVAFNLDKYIFGMLFYLYGQKDNGQKIVKKYKVLDISAAEGQPISELKTVWGEKLTDFHHAILRECMPEFNGKYHDFTEWIRANGGRPALYYEKFMPFLIKDCILVEDFLFSGKEEKFTKEIFLPAFNKTLQETGLKPLVVRLSPEGSETDPTWWHYREHYRSKIDEYIKQKRSAVHVL